MAKKVAFLTRPLLILTWAVLLAAQWPIGVQGVILITNSSNVCGPNVLPALCDTTNSRTYNAWQVNIDCSVPDDTLTVHIGGKSSFEHETFAEVSIHCNSTDGSDQAEMSVNCYSSSEWSRDMVISNVSASGIQPGWTCYLTGCFFLQHFGTGNFLGRTRTNSCTFQGNPTTTTTYLPTTTSTDAATTNLPTTTSTEVHDTLPNTSSTSTEGDVTVPTGVDDLSTTVPETEESSKDLPLSLIASVLVPIFGILITIALLMILLLSWMKQQKARKTALLVLDPQNMIFDPDYTPGICIDKAVHRTSVISNMNYLHFITAMETPNHFQTDVQVVAFDKTDSRFGNNLNMSDSKQQNSGVGATKDMVIGSEEFPGSNISGYVLSGHSNGFNSPQQMDTNQDEFQSPSDSASELTLSCGDCHSSDYIGKTTQLGNSGLVQDDYSSGTNQETLSGDSLSLLMPDDNESVKEAGIIRLDRCSHPSNSSGGYVEQLNTPNKPLTRDDDNVFELDLELAHKQHDGYHNHQTAGYIVDFQNRHQLDLHANHQEAKIACLDNLECPVDESASRTQSTHVEFDCQHFQADMPHLMNTEGYILNEHPTTVALTVTKDRESQEFSVALDCENLFKEEPSQDQSSQLGGLPNLSLDGGINEHNLDTPSEPDMSLNQGYINTEDIDMAKFTSRGIVVPSSQGSPSQIEPSFTVCLDFDNGIASCQDQEKDQTGYVCNSGMEFKCNLGMQLHPQSSVCLDTNNESNDYVISELEQPNSISGTDKREQYYVSYDFRSMASELRDSHSDSTSVISEPVHIHSPDPGPMHINFQPKSNYYPASDMSSGYLSGSSVSGDTSVYLGMDKLKQLDLYSYK